MESTYGYWTLLGPSERRGTNKYFWCRCRCGSEQWVSQAALLNGMSRSCGCARQLPKGRRYGRLTVVQWHKGRRRYECRCDCGNTTFVTTGGLQSGNIVSCGCWRRERRERIKQESAIRNAEYGVWSAMIGRCTNPNRPEYPRYGGRGIWVCDRWRESYANFLADMGHRPSPQHTLDRIDNDGPYSPENCRWTTRYINTRNRTPGYKSTHWIAHDGQTMTLCEWARHLGMDISTLSNRIRRGWDPEVALTKPIKKKRRHS